MNNDHPNIQETLDNTISDILGFPVKTLRDEKANLFLVATENPMTTEQREKIEKYCIARVSNLLGKRLPDSICGISWELAKTE